MVAVIGLVIFSFAWNMRFITAYYHIKTSHKLADAMKIADAAAHMKAASACIPEVKDIRIMACFYDGLALTYQEKWSQAIERFNSCGSALSPELRTAIEDNVINAKIAIAFDNKDYDGFLNLAMQQQNKHPDDSTYAGQVASAYACKYAQSGDEQLKKQALESLEKAGMASRKIKSPEDFENYKQRILHRLYTREVIDHKEFARRFPNGWQQPKEQL
jgi:hypothetical protein